MSVKEFLKDKILFLIVNAVAAVVLVLFCLFLQVKIVYIGGMICLWFIPIISLLLIEFLRRISFYNELTSSLESLDKKYLITEVIEKPEFIDGEIIYEVLKITNKDMHEHVKYHKEMQIDYREYIEAWVHEVKTPIASSKLIIENNATPVTKSIKEELSKIEEFVEQVLYYSRSNDANKDYIVKEFKLDSTIKKIISKNSKDFIHRKIKLSLNEINESVYSDSKWVEFILNQIIVNSIKYSNKSNAEIKIYSNKLENNTVITVEDNGVGISERDIKRVFDKGFTGDNGRIYGKSTGMGLYICNNLAEKLGLGIEIESEVGKGTKVDLIFPHSKVMLLEN